MLFSAGEMFGGYILNVFLELCKGVVWQVGRFLQFLWGKSSVLRQKAFSSLQLFFIFLASPAVKRFRAMKAMREDVKDASQKRGALAACGVFFAHAGHFLFGRKGLAVSLFNLIAPVTCLAFLFGIVSYAMDTNYAVRLEVGGVFLGYIENEHVFSEAEMIVAGRLATIGAGDIPVSTPKYSIEKVGYSDLLTPYQVAETLFSQMGITMEYAYGVFINGRLYGAVRDNTRIKQALENLLDNYRAGFDTESEQVNFLVNIDVDQNELYMSDFIVDEQRIIDIFTSTRSEAQYYEVVYGDSPTLIGDKLNMTQFELEELNPGFSGADLRVGDRIRRSVEVPYLSVAVSRVETYDVLIPYTTEYQDTQLLYEGQSSVARLGIPGVRSVTARVSAVNGVENSRVILGETVTQTPVSEVINRGIKPTPAGTYSTQTASYGKFIWPIGRYSGYISELRWQEGGYAGHSGVDFAAPIGTPVYAVDAGTVVLASSAYSGYGKCVMIDHPSGLRTLYGHFSAVYVSTGETVAQGQCIGLVGMTGWVTGPHVHLEVRVGNSKLNPLDYIDWSQSDRRPRR